MLFLRPEFFILMLYINWLLESENVAFSDGNCPVIVPALNAYLTDRLPAFVSVQDPSLDVIALLRILHAFNRYWSTVYEVNMMLLYS